jgi:peptidoglycan/xylan/chitin deacetylase (PgdA/CDA1 family)
MKIVRRVESRSLFLTFDDGPTIETQKVLDVLKAENVPATFFVVGTRAKANRSILEQIIRDGHSVGHHSLDHTYSAFFASSPRLRQWIEQGKSLLETFGVKSVGFRPPNGIVTPPLMKVLNEMREPLILWNTRFFDAVIPWTRRRALSSLKRIEPGSIILLHDAQSASRIDAFCDVLRDYIQHAKSQGFVFARLTPELIQKQSESIAFNVSKK